MVTANPNSQSKLLPKSQPTTAEFRAFMRNRKSKYAKKGPPSPPPLTMKPTDERLAKEDQPRRLDAGYYRAPAPIERLRDQGKLDLLPHVNQGMYEAACKLYAHFYVGGLGGIAAQDLSRCAGGGDGGSSHFPRDERALHHRQMFREAVSVMGWFEAYPHRGAGRLVVDVICREMAIRDASKIHIPGGRTETYVAAGMDRLREGLFALASHWRLY